MATARQHATNALYFRVRRFGLGLIGLLTRQGFATMLIHRASLFGFSFHVGLSVVVLRTESGCRAAVSDTVIPPVAIAFCISCLYHAAGKHCLRVRASRRIGEETREFSLALEPLSHSGPLRGTPHSGLYYAPSE